MKMMDLPTPCYVIDEGALERNVQILHDIETQAGCKILLAQKAFSGFCAYPLIGKYISGTTASGLYEARLGAEELGKENHIFSPGYKEAEMDDIIRLCDHIVFNSFYQLERFRDRCLAAGKSIGLRINPECSTQEGHAIYDPCGPASRLGVTLSNFQGHSLEGVEGLHFHTLCEQNSDDLERTLQAVEEKFGPYLHQMKWLNFGGGHHITRADYDRERLVRCIRHMKETYGVEVYLEPGEAVALNAGYLVTEVVDIVKNEMDILILDASAACHMPDVLEMPYRPPLQQAGQPGEKAYTYRLSSVTCLAGDIIGDYSFDWEIKRGDRLVFEDMAIYSMVKNNTFNGMALPAICAMDKTGDCRIVKEFGYLDFKERLS